MKVEQIGKFNSPGARRFMKRRKSKANRLNGKKWLDKAPRHPYKGWGD